MQLGRHVAIASASDQIVQLEARAYGQPRARAESVRPDEKGERTEQVRSNARPGAPLGDLLASFEDPPRPHRAQAAVDRPLMIEGQPGAEIRPLDERDRESALGCVVGGKQSMNAPADNQQ